MYTAIDALIVGIETQAKYLVTKKTWTRKIIIVTDAESPIEIEDWEATVEKMNNLDIQLTVVYALVYFGLFSLLIAFCSGIDFDDDELPYKEPNKSNIKVSLLFQPLLAHVLMPIS